MPHIPPTYCFRCPFGREPSGCDLACADALEGEIRHQDPATVAAFIAEPVVGAALAAAVPPEGYWPRIREICDRYGVLLIADEVMTGFGRTGRWFAVDHWGVTPDILVTAKGASGGYWPLGVVLVREDLFAALKDGLGYFAHGFTHANSVMGAAVGLAVLHYLQANDLVAASAAQGAYLRERAKSLLDLPTVGDVRGLGLMVGVELVADRATKAPFARDRRIAERLQAAAMRRGVIIYYGTGLADGLAGDAALLGPPFVITRAEIDQVVSALREAIVEVTDGP
jgi:adenosylmethionine-8-amino-7-oxononanoate aminotransferase